MSVFDDAIYEREDSLEREVVDGDSDNEKNPFDVVGDSDDDKKVGAVVEKVEPKKTKRRISTQPRLNPDKLTGPRGIHKIEEEFKDVKFKGKGHEVQDLDVIMKKLAHWSHRLFPKYTFDDFLNAIDTQTKKKPVQHFMNKYRNDALDDDIVRNVADSDEENDNNANNQTHAPMEPDEFDQMLSEQISKTTNNFNQTLDSELGVRELDMTVASTSSHSRTMQPKASSTLTEEQIKRMEENRLRALEIRKRRMMEQSASPGPSVPKPVEIPVPSTSTNEPSNTPETNTNVNTSNSFTQNFANQEIDMNDLMAFGESEPMEEDLEVMREMDM